MTEETVRVLYSGTLGPQALTHLPGNSSYRWKEGQEREVPARIGRQLISLSGFVELVTPAQYEARFGVPPGLTLTESGCIALTKAVVRAAREQARARQPGEPAQLEAQEAQEPAGEQATEQKPAEPAHQPAEEQAAEHEPAAEPAPKRRKTT